MKRKSRLAITLILCGLSFISCGGKGAQARAKIDIPELGLSMNAPSGWKLDNPRMCSKGDNTCLVMDELLEDKDFLQYAEKLARAQSPRIELKQPTMISGYEAIEAVLEYPNADSKAIKVYIRKGDKLIEVSYVVLAEDFAEFEREIRKSIKSIT